ncbi:hypothetical protein ACTQ1O_06110 [Bilifractor sp. LCP21S3_A7]|uniref:hypothetical protein n=1 Tax=Bilifractor sp. LCP21S3_A7 TaxID=3438738 RepID=UPI003F0190F3
MKNSRDDNKPQGPNNITRALIDASVDRGLREIEEDPKRSIRKLTDMGRMFIKGRFMDEVLSIVQDLLRNDDSPYYEAIEQMLRNTDRKNLKDFGISFGYSGLTYGGKVIREHELSLPYHIPWALTLRINPTLKDGLSVSELESCVRQGTAMGIYCYFIRLSGAITCIGRLMDLVKQHPECAFVSLLPDEPLNPVQVAGIKECTNSMVMFQNRGAATADNVSAMKKNKILYGIYAVYGNEDAAAWYNDQKAEGLAELNAGINLLVSDDTCSKRNGAKVAKYCRSLRTHPEYPMILFDLAGDAVQINHIISEDECYFELLENGDIKTTTETISDFRHTTSLDQLFTIGLPRENPS